MSKNDYKYKKSYAPPCIVDDFGNFHTSNKYYEELHEYIHTGIDNEIAFLRSCRAFNKAELGMGVLYGDSFKKEFKGPSSLQIKKSRRQTREAIANQSDIRQSWTITTTKPDDPLCQDLVNDYNALGNHWWHSQYVDRVVKGAEQYAGGHGTGYVFMWPEYDPLTDEFEIKANYLDYKSVLVGHIPIDNDIQKAYRLDIRLEMPLPLAHERFPEHIDIIKADTEIPSRIARNFVKDEKIYRGLWNWMSRKKKRDAETSIANPFPCTNIIMTFIRDNTINETGNKICMGLVGSHWYYEVPSLYESDGSLGKIGTGVYKEAENGTEEVMRDLTRNDCRLFPNGRLVVSCSGGIIYDGPPQWGDGTWPVAQCYFDKIAGELLGFPVAMDSIGIESAVNNIFQSMEDSVTGKVNPPIGIDHSVPQDIAEVIKRLGVRGLIGKGFQYSVAHLQKAIVPLIAHEYFNIGSEVFKLVELLQQMQDYVAGTQTWTEATMLKQLPGEETQEALMRKLGVISSDQTRDQEKFFLQLGRIWLSFADQVYTLKRRLQIIGADALKPTYIDFDPNRMEQVYKNDPRPRWIVRREHLKNFSSFVAPNSIQERQSTQKKLSLLQIQKMQVPVTDRMIYDAFVGDNKFNEVREEFFVEQKRKAIAAAEIQVEIAKMMQTAGVGGSGSGAGANSIGINNPLIQQVAEALAARFNTEQVGRPPTNNAPARLETKTREGIPDVTLATN